jgi:hypothetical protein
MQIGGGQQLHPRLEEENSNIGLSVRLMTRYAIHIHH